MLYHCGGKHNQEHYCSIPQIRRVRGSQKNVKEERALCPQTRCQQVLFLLSETQLPLCPGPCFSESNLSMDRAIPCCGQMTPKHLPDESTQRQNIYFFGACKLACNTIPRKPSSLDRGDIPSANHLAWIWGPQCLNMCKDGRIQENKTGISPTRNHSHQRINEKEKTLKGES